MNQIDPKLSAAFFFDAVDVAANRSGRLSPTQEQGFQVEASVSRSSVPKVLTLTAIAIVAGFVYSSVQPGADLSQMLLVAGLLLVAFGIIALIARKNLTRAAQLDVAREQPSVLVAEGLPTEHWNTTSDIRSLVVAGVHFRMMWDDIEKFHKDTVYRVYYAMIGKQPRMLSVEVVR